MEQKLQHPPETVSLRAEFRRVTWELQLGPQRRTEEGSAGAGRTVRNHGMRGTRGPRHTAVAFV